MKRSKIVFGIATFIIMTIGHAAPDNSNMLSAKRGKVIKQYVMDLQKADYKHIVQLFEKNGIVISTSRGKIDAKEFFYSFLPNIDSANTDLHQIFNNDMNTDRMAARFQFKFKLKDGEEGNGEYVDEFVFANHSIKLSGVYMFENLKFTNDL